ncbi:MAG: A/G-specific adenine glycosylase [Leptospiraceae bacterium]|nr:A/G-specific adenine glycosylase [Leptospiraceae bacterium]MCP5501935.1 A/G-specific adenine glycosylase [Leptospiraceae bacterium]
MKQEIIQDKLLQWFYENRRELPFRKNPEVYRIWVSEIMLQQTRVAHMLPSYQNFMQRFPSIQTLANSKEEEVLQYWKGLGYYSRALNLHKAARYIQKDCGGVFPETLSEALKIPGIGPYTARAVLSIALDKPYAVLDGNVKRVLSRFFLYEKDITLPKSHKELQELADSFLNQAKSGDHNQAMMELGALVCTQTPTCEHCPLKRDCLAKKESKAHLLPVTKKEKEKIALVLKFYIIEYSNKLLLLKEGERMFFKTIYSLPFLAQNQKEGEAYRNTETCRQLLKSFSFHKMKGFFKHSITKYDIQTEVYTTQASSIQFMKELLKSIDYKWIDKKDLINEFPSSIAKKIIKLQGKGVSAND